jgi:hypothetical protein
MDTQKVIQLSVTLSVVIFATLMSRPFPRPMLEE